MGRVDGSRASSKGRNVMDAHKGKAEALEPWPTPMRDLLGWYAPRVAAQLRDDLGERSGEFTIAVRKADAVMLVRRGEEVVAEVNLGWRSWTVLGRTDTAPLGCDWPEAIGALVAHALVTA